MNINFTAAMQTASEKYTSLMDLAYQAKNGGDIDYDKLINLIHSVYMNEVQLITNMYSEDVKKEETRRIEVPSFKRKET